MFSYCLDISTLNWASGGPVTMTMRIFESGVSAGAIWKTKKRRELN